MTQQNKRLSKTQQHPDNIYNHMKLLQHKN